MKSKLIIFGVILIGGIMLTSCSRFGTRPSKEDKEKFKTSANFNSSIGKFENRRPELIAQMKERTMSWDLIKKWLKGGVDTVPDQKLPEVRPDLINFMQPSNELKVIWLGHSTLLLNFGGKVILIDPVFSKSAAPVNFLVKRFQAPAIKMDDLPPVDFIVISHDHYDHLDMNSIKFFKDSKTKFLVPLGVGSHIKGWGIQEKQISEFDWWNEMNFDGLKFIATPAQHFSGRTGMHDNETLWASWVIQNEKHNIYYSGDSGYDVHFKQIGDKYGPFDLAFIENGQYNEDWKEVHMLPEEGAQAYFDLRAKRYFPIHWGMFELSLHSWYEPAEKILAEAKKKNINLVTPIIGQIINVGKEDYSIAWWKELIPKKSSPKDKIAIDYKDQKIDAH